jgi:hypothetical protein
MATSELVNGGAKPVTPLLEPTAAVLVPGFALLESAVFVIPLKLQLINKTTYKFKQSLIAFIITAYFLRVVE